MSLFVVISNTLTVVVLHISASDCEDGHHVFMHGEYTAVGVTPILPAFLVTGAARMQSHLLTYGDRNECMNMDLEEKSY